LAELEGPALAAFERGRAVFDRQFEASDGLGPLFNQARCSSCHDIPTLGGAGVEFIRKATAYHAESGCDLLTEQGGDNIQQRTTQALIDVGLLREPTPSAATHVIDMVAPALYGLGLVERVTEAAVRARHDPDDRDGDGISGRAIDTPDGLGRFGAKADHATLRGFVEGALFAEMGLTTAAIPVEPLPGGIPLPQGSDPVAEPEIGEDDLLDLLAYVAGLAPPERRPAEPEERAQAERGEVVFSALGCTGCHVPALPTRDGGAVALYSDLLVHDLGPENADICSQATTPAEFRTAMLAGLRFRNHLLHNGKGRRLEDAIELHGGEAESVRANFFGLDPQDREALLSFLRTL